MSAAASQRPNVLFILADDLGYGDLSCYGRPDYQTPVLDTFAKQGIQFTSVGHSYRSHSRNPLRC